MTQCGAFDFSSLKNELTSINENLTSAARKLPKTFEITALSWDISGPGSPNIRYFFVPKTVADINPDVVLLQEVESQKMVKYIDSTCSLWCGRSYECVSARVIKEARVLYDSEVFTSLLQQPEENMDLEPFVAKVFKPLDKGLRSGGKVTEDDIYEDQVAAVPLQHKVTGKWIIFMSFYNKTRPFKDLAEGLCAVISKIAEKEKALVVTGGHFNCVEFDVGSALRPRYAQRGRRLPKESHFVLAGPGSRKNAVTAPNIIPDTGLGQSSEIVYSSRQYSDSLNYDPLVCELNLMKSMTCGK